MPGTVHLLVGAAIAATVPSLPLMVVLAFFSHYILDSLPHLDPETFWDDATPYTWWQKATLAVDVVLVISLLTVLWLLRNEPLTFLLGAIVAQLPDLMVPLEKYTVFTPLRRIHEMLHWDKTRARWWSWYIPALVIPVVISIGALLTVWSNLMDA